MKKAGVKLPLMHRAWLMVKDHPGATSPRIAQLLKAKEADVSSTMSQLRRRKMVDFKMETVKGRMGIGIGTREVYTYSVPPRMKEYELLPLVVPKNKVKGPAPSPAPAEAAPAPAVAPALPPGDGFINALRQGATPMPIFAPPKPLRLDLPVQMLDPEPTAPHIPTHEEIDRWSLSEARKVYDYLKSYFAA